MYHLSFCFVGEVVLIWEGELGNEVRQSVYFNSCLGVVLDVELAKLDRPLDHSPYFLELVHRLLNGLVRHYQDGVHLEIWLQLA